MPAYASWTGAAIAEIPVTHHERRFGRSKYGIWRASRVMLDLLTVKLLGSYATKPIYFFGAFGFLLALLALVFRDGFFHDQRRIDPFQKCDLCRIAFPDAELDDPSVATLPLR